MDIVNRIKTFMNANGIGSTQFADACRIPRPTLSQILSGRNKKISDEVISKIHDAYPQLSVLWLLFGEGEMLARGNGGVSESLPGQTQSPKQTTYDAGYRSGEMSIPAHLNDEEPGLFGSDALIFGDEDTTERPAGAATIESDEDASAPVVQVPADGTKSIVNIMVFYSDNSYQSFVPR